MKCYLVLNACFMERMIWKKKELRGREEISFDQFYDQYAHLFYGYIKHLLCNEKLSSQILEDSFIKIWNSLQHWNPSRENLFIFSFKIVRKTAMDKKVELTLKELFSCQKVA